MCLYFKNVIGAGGFLAAGFILPFFRRVSAC